MHHRGNISQLLSNFMVTSNLCELLLFLNDILNVIRFNLFIYYCS